MATLDLSCEGLTLVPAGKKHARDLARIMRSADVEEMQSCGGHLPEKATRASINRSCEAWAVYAGTDLLCVFGISPFEGAQVCWLLGSVHIAKHRRAFWRSSKIAIEQLRSRYPRMFNMVLARNQTTLSWLKRLGFKIGDPQPYGLKGDFFSPVSLETPRLIQEVRHV